MKICHISSVHNNNDTRIFTKQCKTLANIGHQVTLVITDEEDNVRDGVKIKALKKRSTALMRLLFNIPQILFYTIRNKHDVYHAHDPELLPVLFLLHLLGRKVVYDMHENFPKQLKHKKVSKVVKWFVGKLWPFMEKVVLSRINVVFAETSYKDDYGYVTQSVEVLNMPILEHLGSMNKNKDKDEKNFSIGYVGAITEDRYCLKILEVLLKLQNQGINIRFDLIGPVDRQSTQDFIDDYSKKLKNFHYYGRLPPEESWNIISSCDVGVSVLMPIPNYIDSYPTKMFEYIALGLPVIASDFELYKGIIEKNKVGICVSPLNVNEFESALLRLREDQSLLQEMKDNTQGILERNYSWSNELNKLDSFYSGIVAA